AGTLTLLDILRTGRNWTYATGSLAPGTSSVVFTGSGGGVITGDHALANVEIRGGTITIAAGTTLTVAGMTTLTDGNLNGGTLEALADISLLGTFDGETATILIAGTGDQTLTGTATATTGDAPNVTIDKPSGTLFLVGTIRLTTAAWTWLSGAVDPGTSLLVLDTGTTISGTHTLNDVLLRGGAHTIGGGMPTAAGTLTLEDGTINGGTFGAAGDVDQLPTFDGGSGALEINGVTDQTFTGTATLALGDLPNVVIDKSGGTLFLVGTLRMSGASWTHVGGTVDAGSSLLVVVGTSSLAAAGMTFNNLTVNGGTTTLTQDLNVGGDLVVAAGTLNGAGMTIVVAGDVTIDGAFTPGTGLLVMNGVVPQVLGGAAANIGLYDYTVNNAPGVTITTDVSVAGTLTLNGPLDISGQTLGIANPIAGTPTNLTGDPLSSLVVSGTGAGIVIPSTLPVLANLTLDNPNGAALAGPLTIGSLLTLTDGVL
ncbi:MAG: beta strand repeat-containing protein, partial [Candidatus Limnocylindria bacterium]